MRATASIGVVIIGMAIAAGYWFVSKGGERSTHRASSDSLGSSSSESIQPERDMNDALRSQVAQLELKVAALTAHAASEKPNSGGPEEVSPTETNSPTSAEALRSR